jgi:hypothetical protein
MRQKFIVTAYSLFIGLVFFSSCSEVEDNYSTFTGKTDPATIESANFKAYFPLESKYILTYGGGIDSSLSDIVIGDSSDFSTGVRGAAFYGDTVSSYLKIPLQTNVFLKSLQEFTLSFWMKAPTETSKIMNILMVNGGNDTYGTLSLTLDSLYLQGSVYNTLTDSTYYVSVSRDVVKSGVWSYITFSYSKESSELALYTNGSLSNEVLCNDSTAAPMDTLTLSSSMKYLYIGAWPQQIANTATSNMGYFPGCLDEMRIWNKCLTAGEVNTLYQAELSLSTGL